MRIVRKLLVIISVAGLIGVAWTYVRLVQTDSFGVELYQSDNIDVSASNSRLGFVVWMYCTQCGYWPHDEGCTVHANSFYSSQVWSPFPSQTGFTWSRDPWPDIDSFAVAVPLPWLAILFIALPAIEFIRGPLRRRRRRRRGLCVPCGYDLRGNISGVCPECGHPTPAGASRAHVPDEGE
jgi:hypothetical protein